MVDGPPALLFQHLPKTAGTSLRHALAAVYSPDERVFVYNPTDLEGALSIDQFRELPAERRSQLRLVMGHFQYGLHAWIGRPARYVTTLRDPVDRVVSLYYHFKLLGANDRRSRGYQERQRIEEEDISLAEWVFESEQLQADNGMVRQIARRPGLRFGACPDDLLDEALAHIDQHYEAVLIRGSMAQSVEILSRLAGTSLPRLERRNVNAGRAPVSAIDPQLRRRILELNHLDMQLFRRMVDRFPETYDRIVG